MSKVSISEAIRLVGISRSQFYTKYINEGIISVQLENDKKFIDISELIRVFGNVQLVNVKPDLKWGHFTPHFC
jgi:ACT domain-containing protein